MAEIINSGTGGRGYEPPQQYFELKTTTVS
jgi:hypothetical protein